MLTYTFHFNTDESCLNHQVNHPIQQKQKKKYYIVNGQTPTAIILLRYEPTSDCPFRLLPAVIGVSSTGRPATFKPYLYERSRRIYMHIYFTKAPRPSVSIDSLLFTKNKEKKIDRREDYSSTGANANTLAGGPLADVYVCKST